MMSTIRTYLFSAFFWVFAFAFMMLLALATIAARLFVSYPKIHHLIPAPGFAFLARLATRGRLEVHYHPNFSRTRPSVFCQNHVNLLDAHVASAAIPTPFCGLMDSWQQHIPFYGWLMRLSHGILIDRKRKGILHQITLAAHERNRNGMSILVLPEGHRTRDGKVREFKTGVFFMARDAGYPVVPVAVQGMYAVNRRKSYLFHPGSVRVFVGPQFETRGLSDNEVRDLSNTLRLWISEHADVDVSESKRNEAA